MGCTSLYFAQVNAQWQTHLHLHFTRPSQHPQTTDTVSTLRTSSTPPQANTPHRSGAPPSHRRTGLPGAEDALWIKRTHSCPAHSPTPCQPRVHAHLHAQPLHMRTHTSTNSRVLTFSPSITFFPPPNGSCRQGGPGSAGREVPEKGSQPPAAGSTSGLQRKNERGRLLLQSQRGVQHSPWLPKSDRNAFLSLAPPPLTRRLQSEGLYRA